MDTEKQSLIGQRHGLPAWTGIADRRTAVCDQFFPSSLTMTWKLFKVQDAKL
jgi:hypothetical protein